MTSDRDAPVAAPSSAEVETQQDFPAYESPEARATTSPETPTAREPYDLLGVLLAEQQSLTAVEEFSWAHEAGAVHAQFRYYSKLLPATPPGPGQQYAFDVDLDRCSGCKACVTACHSLNGLDETETWREVGQLIGGDAANPLLQHVTTACHHCVDPGCLAGCPVDAYEKDPITGIVRHLDDQCFGCQYCTMTCPYEVPKYHAEKGIVRKCDMCTQRLDVGEAPACVQACPHEAIAITVVDVEDVAQRSTGTSLVPSAPESCITKPTTIYRTNRDAVPVRPADDGVLRPQHAHLPLVLMLVLSQLAAGAFLVGAMLSSFGGLSVGDEFPRWNATAAVVALQAALAASTLHLGRPLYAFRGIIGWRHSWLSREILAFGAFAGLAMPFTALFWMPLLGNGIRDTLGWAVVATGAAGVFCSAMIYDFTRRTSWTLSRTGPRFLLTSLVLGLATSLAVATLQPDARTSIRLLAIGLVASSVLKLGFDALVVRESSDPSLRRSAALVAGPLRRHAIVRIAAGATGGIFLPIVALCGVPTGVLATIGLVSLVLCIVGELFERYLFFAAVSPPKMPGGVTS